MYLSRCRSVASSASLSISFLPASPFADCRLPHRAGRVWRDPCGLHSLARVAGGFPTWPTHSRPNGRHGIGWAQLAGACQAGPGQPAAFNAKALCGDPGMFPILLTSLENPTTQQPAMSNSHPRSATAACTAQPPRLSFQHRKSAPPPTATYSLPVGDVSPLFASSLVPPSP